MFSLTDSQGRVQVDLKAVPMGKDLCLIITGGDLPHLGAMALAQVRPSLANPAQLSASTSLITLLGHKEDALAKEVAETLSVKLNRNVVVCCGIHLDHATAAEISLVSALVKNLVHTLIKEFKNNSASTP